MEGLVLDSSLLHSALHRLHCAVRVPDRSSGAQLEQFNMAERAGLPGDYLGTSLVRLLGDGVVDGGGDLGVGRGKSTGVCHCNHLDGV